MNKFLLAASAAAVALGAQGANAATFLVGIPVVDVIPHVSGGAYNDFKPELNALGLVNEAPGASVSINTTPGAQTYITFEFLGSESGNSDTFSFNGSPLMTETSTLETHFGQGLHAGDTAPINLGTFNWNSALFPALFSGTGASANAGPGQFGFTVFLPAGVGTGSYESNVIYFGYDDIPGGDDNHDDIIIRATIASVPEPTTWALMVAGIAAVGFSMRRRSQNVRVAFS